MDYSKIKALIVDDSKTICRINKQILLSVGISDIEIEYDGKAGLDNFKKNDYNLVLSDINMPIMDGFELVEKIRKIKNKEECPVFMITTEGGRGEVIKALRLGANNYLVKPLQKESLIEKLHSFYNN